MVTARGENLLDPKGLVVHILDSLAKGKELRVNLIGRFWHIFFMETLKLIGPVTDEGDYLNS